MPPILLGSTTTQLTRFTTPLPQNPPLLKTADTKPVGGGFSTGFQNTETVLFGASSTAAYLNTQKQASSHTHVPHWVNKIPKPRYSMPNLWPLAETLEEDVSALRQGKRSAAVFQRVQRKVLRLYFMYQKIQKELRDSSLPYLPEPQKQQALDFRHSSSYRFKRLFAPRKTMRQLITMQGPAAIKRAQEEYQLTEKLSNDLASQIENLKRLKQLPLRLKFLKYQVILLMQLIRMKMLWDISIYKPLGNDVPALPKEQMAPQINTVLKAYNKNHPHAKLHFDDIQSKPLASGSMGQVFLAKSHGEKLIVKIQRGTPEEMAAYLPYVYYCKTILVGSDNKRLCFDEARKQVNTLQDEADSRNEQQNAVTMAKYVTSKRLKNVTVPLPLAAVQSGLVMPFIGENDLSSLDAKEREPILRKIAPDLLRIQICSPNKLADLYFPNIRTPLPAFLIDQGRMFRLLPETHQKLLKLATVTMASPEHPYGWASDLAIRQAIIELLTVNGHQARGLAAQLQMAAQYGIDEPIQEFLHALFKPNPLFMENNALNKGTALMRGTQRFPGGEPELNLLGFWNNYLLLFSPERGFPPLLDATKNDMPALVDLSSGYNKFKNTLGSGFSSGSDIPETELKRWVQQQTKLPKRKISANVMQQYSQMAALSDTSKDLARAMIEESGLSGRLSVEQRKNLKRRLNIALYCDLLG